MKTQFLTCSAGVLLLSPTSAPAGTRSAGSGASAVTIPADVLDAGGAKSTAGSGANAVAITASLGGIGGSVAAASPVISNAQGYIPQILPAPPGYALWAAANIPPGQDATFSGDWNHDGIANGMAYVFGNTRPAALPAPASEGRIPVPPVFPPDVNIYLDWSIALSDWGEIVRWSGGAAPVFSYPLNTRVANGIVEDGGTFGPHYFYRYRVEQR